MLRFRLSDDAELREVTAGDVDEVYAVSLANQEHLAPWMPWARDLRRSETQAWIDAALAQRAADNGAQFVFTVGGVVAGGAGYHRVDRRNLATSLGYWIAERHQGKGLVTAAARALTEHAFGEWGLHRVEICCGPANARSRAVPERLGFTEEGLRRGGEWFPDGFRDLIVYSRLATD